MNCKVSRIPSPVWISLGMAMLLLSAARTSAAPAPAIAQRLNCSNPQTQADMNACAGMAYRNADRQLNRVYQQLLAKLPAARKQKLIVAEQAWIKFRDTSCDFEKSEAEGGTLAPTLYGQCLATVTEQRTRDLERYLEATNR